MSRESIAAAILGTIVVGVLIVVALTPGSTTTAVLPSIDIDDVESVGPNEAVVITKYESGGSSILGFTIGRTRHLVRVQFFDDSGCRAVISSGDPWPTSAPECAPSG